MRAMCGMTSPTQPITPEMATTLAVISVAAAITASRSRPASTPSAFASSSPSDSTLMRQRRSRSGSRPTSTMGSAVHTSLLRMAEKLPSSQNTMAGSWS